MEAILPALVTMGILQFIAAVAWAVRIQQRMAAIEQNHIAMERAQAANARELHEIKDATRRIEIVIAENHARTDEQIKSLFERTKKP